MADPTLTITLSQTGDDLVFSGTLDGSSTHGILRYTQPARQRRYRAMPDSDSTHGTEYIGSSIQQANIIFDWCPDTATDESDVAAAYAAACAALDQFEFTVTTDVSDASAEVWAANAGSIVPADARDYPNLANHNPVWTVTIPVYPLAS